MGALKKVLKPSNLFKSNKCKSSDQQQQQHDIIRYIGDRSVRLGPKVGSGGFGTVYSGTLSSRIDTKLSQTVAVKVIHYSEEIAKDPMREADTLLQFRNNPHIVNYMTVLPWERAIPSAWIVMELCRMNLREFFKAKRWRLFPGEQFQILLQLNRGLLAVHQRNLVHRDIKAGNILVNGDPDRPWGVIYKVFQQM